MKQHIYRAWIKPLKKYASDIAMEFTSYGIPPMISACMQGEKEYSGDDVILEQYTGLTDKNGVKIFEGDIVFLDYNHIGSKKVIFQNGGFNIAGYAIKRGEVIGNINENP